MVLTRPLSSIAFEPHEEKMISLGDPIFLHFLGIFRVVIIIGESQGQFLGTGLPTRLLEFHSIFADYSRDAEGYRMQIQMVHLTETIGHLTIVLIILTLALIIFSIVTFVYSG